MGISTPVLRFLLAASARGVDFSDTLTIGVQSFSTPLETARALLREHGHDLPADHLASLRADASGLFRHLGARRVRALDADAYQGAELLADLNQPLPAGLHGGATTLFDGGSIEHVFDVRQVVDNYRELVAEGGHLLCVTACNNLCGHGFYQFSPEFFYATFSQPRGWIVESVLVSTVGRRPRFFHAPDPSALGRRVALRSRQPLYIYLVARKIDAPRPREHTPQQADYRRSWSTGDDEPRAPKRTAPRLRLRLKRFVRSALARSGLFDHRFHGLGQRFYRPLSARDLVHGRLRPDDERGATESTR